MAWQHIARFQQITESDLKRRKSCFLNIALIWQNDYISNILYYTSRAYALKWPSLMNFEFRLILRIWVRWRVSFFWTLNDFNLGQDSDPDKNLIQILSFQATYLYNCKDTLESKIHISDSFLRKWSCYTLFTRIWYPTRNMKRTCFPQYGWL